jgi:hypothetical protein
MEVKHSQHWPSKEKQGRFRLISLQTQNGARCISAGSVTLVFVANCFEGRHMLLSVSFCIDKQIMKLFQLYDELMPWQNLCLETQSS